MSRDRREGASLTPGPHLEGQGVISPFPTGEGEGEGLPAHSSSPTDPEASNDGVPLTLALSQRERGNDTLALSQREREVRSDRRDAPRPIVRRPNPATVFLVLTLLLGIVLVLGTTFGSVSIDARSLAEMVLNRLGLIHISATWRPQDEVIVFDVRLPRVVAAALIGIALATSGTLFQGLLRNPLADPFLLGTSGGASLGAIVGILVATPLDLLGFGIVPVASFVGALVSTGLVYRLARVGGRTPVVPLLLAGFAVSTVLNYLVSLLLIVNDRLQLNVPRIYAWLLGGVSVSDWTQLGLAGPAVLIVTILAIGLGQSLNALSLGDEPAERLGVPVERDKSLVIIAASLLTGIAVTLGGLIGFVGLVVPHIVRLATGPDNRLLIPAAALAGASFVVLADLLARTILTPTELPVGILTAFLGGPYFLFLLRRERREYRL